MASAMFHRTDRHEKGKPLLDVKGLSRKGKFQDISLEINAGEIVGVAGLVGAGRTDLARALFGSSPDWEGQPWRCPACSGDTFRFVGPEQVRCMTCSSLGKIRAGKGGISFSIEPPENHFFLTLEGARRHLDWLRGMKKQFLEKRKQLKAIRLDYRHE